MKITNKINDLKVGEVLKEGNCKDYITFEKYVPTFKTEDNHINLRIQYLNTTVAIGYVANGITDEQLGEAME